MGEQLHNHEREEPEPAAEASEQAPPSTAAAAPESGPPASRKRAAPPSQQRPPRKKGARGPLSTRTPAMVNRICALIARGRSLREVCRQEWAPSLNTWLRWVAEDEETHQRYVRARVARGDYYGDEVARIGRGVLAGKILPDAGRVAADAFKWTAGKCAPGRWGDRVELTHAGTVTQVRRVVLSVEGLNDDQRAVLGALAAGPVDAAGVRELPGAAADEQEHER